MAGSHAPVELVTDQDAVADEVPGLGGHPLVVPAHRGQAVFDGPVASHVHHRRAVAQGAEVVEGGERRSGVGGFIPQGAVQLSGVTDRFVDGEPEVGGVDDQVVGAGVDGWRRDLLGQELGQGSQLGVPVPAGAGEVLPSAPGRGSQGAHGVELPGLLVDSHRRRCRVDPDSLLHRGGAGEVGVELILLVGQDGGVGVVDAGVCEQGGRPVQQKSGPLRGRNVEGVDVVRGNPGTGRVDRLADQLDALRAEGG